VTTGEEKLPFADLKGVCPNCRLNVAFIEMDTRMAWPGYIPGPFESRPSRYVVELVWLCQSCDRSVLLLEHYRRTPTGDGKLEEQMVRQQLVWPSPQPRRLDDAVPSAVRSLFAEGSMCELTGAYRAAAAMYRAAVEKLCDDQGAPKGKLYHRLEHLKSAGASADLVADLHEARALGNDSLHEGLEFAPEEVADVADLIEEAVTLLYVQPAERASMKEARQRRRAASRTKKNT
jgi:hypothetical protein